MATPAEQAPWLKHYEQGVPHHLDYPRKTIDDLLKDSARQHPLRIATNYVLKYTGPNNLVTIGGKLTFRKLNRLVDSFANALYQLGVRPGDRVALVLPNSPQYVISFFAALRIGAVIVNHNPLYTSAELEHQLRDSGAETVILLDRGWPRLNEIYRNLPIKRVVVCRLFDTLRAPIKRLVQQNFRKAEPPPDIPLNQKIYYFQGLLDNYAPEPPAVAVSPDDIALLQYTGGTTGVPKGAMLTHRNLVSNNLQCLTWMFKDRIGKEKACVLGAIPFFHVYGLQTAMLASIANGSELVIMPVPKPAVALMSVIAREKCTLFPGVPAMYLSITNSDKLKDYDISSIKVCVSGSAPLPLAIQEKFGELTGGRLVEGFGMSETSPATHINPINGTRKDGSIGVPIPDTEAKIVDTESGADLPFDGEARGELVVRGPQVMRGYWQRPDETAATIDKDGWLHTGDICTVDTDGYFFIVDRKKDMIIASGLKVLPREVEEVLFRHPKVADAAVVGVRHPVRGDDTVTAFVVLKPGEQATAAEIQDFCKQELAPFKVPRVVRFKEELPKTMVGKTLRRQLMAEELQLQATGQAQP